jgi:hypothetical protein
MGRMKSIVLICLSVAIYGCSPAWAYSPSVHADEIEDSNYELINDFCENQHVAVLLSHDGKVFRDSKGGISFPPGSDIMLLPCELEVALKGCPSHRGFFHWSPTSSENPVSSIEGDSFECKVP